MNKLIFMYSTVCKIGVYTPESMTNNEVNKTYFKKDHACSLNGEKLLPIMDPKFNLRESSKHMILLEDHLFNSKKRCIDCIKKHFLTIEAFLEEGITLDKKMEYKEVYDDVLNNFKEALKYFSEGIKNGDKDVFCKTGQMIRKVRKPITYSTFDYIF